MDKKEIIKLLEEYAVQEHSNTLNRVIEMQDFDDLADELVKLFSIHIVSNSYSDCCNAVIDTDEQSLDICTNCGDRI